LHDAIAAVETGRFRGDALPAAIESEDDKESVAIRPSPKNERVSRDHSDPGAFDWFPFDVDRKSGNPRWLVGPRELRQLGKHDDCRERDNEGQRAR
jgi:hypothetical protein